MPHRLWLFVPSVILFITTGLHAQNALYIEHKGKGCLVRAARENRPCIEISGKLQPVIAYRIALKEAKDFLPFFVTIDGLKAKSFQLESSDTNQSFNHELKFSAEFQSAYPLERVFLLLDIDSQESGKGYFLHEVGTLSPYKSKHIELTAPLSRPLGAGQFTIHLFSDGAELLNSSMPAEVCEQALDRMIARRVGKLKDAGPLPFVGPMPQYPDKFRKSKIEGHAVISVRIATSGAIADPEILSATTPEFGESALSAAKLWRFIPAVRNGQAIEVKAEMPFDFKAPSSDENSDG